MQSNTQWKVYHELAQLICNYHQIIKPSNICINIYQIIMKLENQLFGSKIDIKKNLIIKLFTLTAESLSSASSEKF